MTVEIPSILPKTTVVHMRAGGISVYLQWGKKLRIDLYGDTIKYIPGKGHNTYILYHGDFCVGSWEAKEEEFEEIRVSCKNEVIKSAQVSKTICKS